MGKISREDVRHIAKLARLQLSGDEEKKYQRDLSAVLEYFEQLQKVGVSQAEPMTHSVPAQNKVREDIAQRPDSKLTALLKKAARVGKEGFVEVQAILNHGA